MASDTPSRVDQSLIGYPSRVFLPPSISPAGNYADSVISAALVSGSGADFDAAAIDGTAGQDLNIVLFTSDALASLSIECWAGNVSVVEDLGGGAGSGGYEKINAVGFIGTSATIGPFTGTDIQAVSGVTPAGEQNVWAIHDVVDVKGYGVQVSGGPKLQKDDLGVMVTAIAQSGVVHGWANHAYADSDVLSAVVSVIMPSNLYTQAIRDNGNIIEMDVVGPPSGKQFARVVGVWESPVID